ncbi:hypothetical protein [Actinokineospora sp. NPDC004072]
MTQHLPAARRGPAPPPGHRHPPHRGAPARPARRGGTMGLLVLAPDPDPPGAQEAG